MRNDHSTAGARGSSGRGTTAAIVVVVALLALLPTVPAAGATRHKRQRCHLAGTNLAHSTRIRVVLVRTHDGGQALRGCVRPNGHVFTLTSLGDLGLGSGTISLEQVAGTWVAVRVESSNQYAADQSTGVIDLRTRRSYSIFYVDEGIGEQGPFPGIDAYVLDRHGRTAVAEHVVTSDTAGHALLVEQIDSYAPDGTALVLDNGDPMTVPSSSLSFSAGVIGWTHGGEHRTVHFR